jgi:phage terminase Nu1 subunit (DNA packaging protein)
MLTVTLADGGVLDVGRWPLPEGLDDSVLLNRTQLATAFGVSENTVGKYVSQGMPVETAGSNGVSYEFRLSHCYAWRMDRNEKAQAQRAKSDLVAQQAALAFLNLDEDDAEEVGHLSADEVRRRSEAEYQRNRTAEQRRDLLRAGPMAALLEDLMTMVRTRVMAVPDFAEQEFGLSATDTAKLEGFCDRLLGDMRHRIDQDIIKPGSVVLAFPGSDNQRELAL